MSDSALVIISGMHRSGTSLLAKAVNVAGADLGDKFLPPGLDNPKGFWEDPDIFELNNKLLDAVDLRWDIPAVLPFLDFSDFTLTQLHTEALAIIQGKLVNHKIYAIKDPRFCLTLPFWWPLLKDQVNHVCCIVSVRNPLEVANSLSIRNNFDQKKGLILWLNYNYLILHHLSKFSIDSLFVSYHNLLDNPSKQLHRIARFLGKKRIDSKLATWFRNEFVDRQLRHSCSTLEEVQYMDHHINGLSSLYETLCNFSNGRWSEKQAKKVLNKLDSLLLEVNSYRYQRRYFKIELIDKVNELEKKYEELKKVNGILRVKQRELEKKNKKLKEVNRALQDLQVKLYDLECELNKRDEEIVRLKRELETKSYSQLETDRHLKGALQQIHDIKYSLSYRLGRAITWPARVVYDSISKQRLANLLLALKLIKLAVLHPIRFFKLLNLERIRNAYITFFKNPSSAASVIEYYSRILDYNYKLDSFKFSLSSDKFDKFKFEGNYGYVHATKVSIIVVNYNGISYLKGLFSSICEQSYKDFEVIFVDNGSSDGSVEYIKENFKNLKLKVVFLKKNYGFAEGVNIAAEVADGQYLALINNDMQLDKDWLKELVFCLEKNYPYVGAVGSKILFWKKFSLIKIKSKNSANLYLDLSSLEDSAQVYKKWFFKTPVVEGLYFFNKRCIKFNNKLDFYFPVCEGQLSINLRLLSDLDTTILVKVSSNENLYSFEIYSNNWVEFNIDLFNSDKPELYYLINNAGSEIDDFGEVKDRGFGEVDNGQYDYCESVSALCGGSMLIRRDVLQNMPIFSKHFFAYYEDTELSLRLIKSGYGLFFCPKSIAYHRHASTSLENSAFFRYYVNRNKILFLVSHYPESIWKPKLDKLKLELAHIEKYYSKDGSIEEKEFAKKIPMIFDEWEYLLPLIRSGKFLDRNNFFLKIGVYNSFWHTYGGAEHHAGVIAQVLQKYGAVDLISENDFSILELEKKFDLKLKFCRKRIIAPEVIHHNPDMTSQYDILINSTFSSDLISYARLSYYIVSFPYKLFDNKGGRFLESYKRFLANSKYTAYWVSRWWKKSADVLYPSIHFPYPLKIYSGKKEKIILNVGRFFKIGHNKKQLEMVKVFRRLKDEHILDRDWRLVLVGNVHIDQIEYLELVKNEAIGYPIDIYADLNLYDLRELYARSAIYWHATGLGENAEINPDLFEHFGISTLEAMSYGCIPVVMNGGGQVEIVEHGVNGFIFSNESDLMHYTKYCADIFSTDEHKYNELSTSAIRRANCFSRQVLEERFLKILESDGYKIPNDFVLS